MASKILVRTRDALGELWLPWCVDADDPERTVHDHNPPALHPRAAQLRITDLNLPVIQRALARQPYRDARSWDKITGIASDYRRRAAGGEMIIVDEEPDVRDYTQPTLMTYDGVRMLCEGSHRSSALWISEVGRFELRLVESRLSWPGYENPQIRVRGRPFPRCASP